MKNQTVAIIPARGGSKGVPRKNVLTLGGTPLIAHSILHAKQAKQVDQVYVSTDDNEIMSISKGYGAEIIDRPRDISGDTSTSESALLHALNHLEDEHINPSLIVFLQCTSPIRSGTDIDNAINKLQIDDADSLVSVSPSHRFLWEEVQGNAKSINYDYQTRPRRQDMERQYVENGSIYIFKPWVLKKYNNRLGGKLSMFVMCEEASWEIDSIFDFKVAELLINKKD